MNKGKFALLFTFAACLSVIVFLWLLAVPLENFTAERIVMVLLISPIFAILLAFNLSRFLKQHGYFSPFYCMENTIENPIYAK